MKSDSEPRGHGLLFATGGFAILIGVMIFFAGCKAKTPLSDGFPLPYPTPSFELQYLKVCDFESTLSVNPVLFDPGNPPTYALRDPGGVGSWGGDTVTIDFAGPETGGAEGTSNAYACRGTIVDLADGEYPSFNVNIPFRSDSTVYDMSAFTGVRYQLKVGNDDNAAWRALTIPLSTTMPVTNGGACENECYDHFYVTYGPTDGAWVSVVNDFADFKRQGYGAALVPTNLAGSNLGKALRLEWVESNRNAPGTIRFNFSVDEIRFY